MRSKKHPLDSQRKAGSLKELNPYTPLSKKIQANFKDSLVSETFNRIFKNHERLTDPFSIALWSQRIYEERIKRSVNNEFMLDLLPSELLGEIRSDPNIWQEQPFLYTLIQKGSPSYKTLVPILNNNWTMDNWINYLRYGQTREISYINNDDLNITRDEYISYAKKLLIENPLTSEEVSIRILQIYNILKSFTKQEIKELVENPEIPYCALRAICLDLNGSNRGLSFIETMALLLVKHPNSRSHILVSLLQQYIYKDGQIQSREFFEYAIDAVYQDRKIGNQYLIKAIVKRTINPLDKTFSLQSWKGKDIKSSKNKLFFELLNQLPKDFELDYDCQRVLKELIINGEQLVFRAKGPARADISVQERIKLGHWLLGRKDIARQETTYTKEILAWLEKDNLRP